MKRDDWMLYVSVGDVVEAECEVASLTSAEDPPERIPGTPGLYGCVLLKTPGVTLPTPTPTPTPEPEPTFEPTETPMPCVKVMFGDSREWLLIDCPADRVVVGRAPDPDNPDDFQFYSEGDSTAVSYSFWVGNTRTSPRSSQWGRRIGSLEEELGQGKGLEGEVWEAPLDQAARIISTWRSGGWQRLALHIEEDWAMTFQLFDPK